MLVGFQNIIQNISIDDPDVMSALPNVNYTYSLKTFTPFDYSYRTNEVFWWDVGHESVYKTSMGRRQSPEIIRDLFNNTTVYGLAVDWVYQHVYYTQCWVNAILFPCSAMDQNRRLPYFWGQHPRKFLRKKTEGEISKEKCPKMFPQKIWKSFICFNHPTMAKTMRWSGLFCFVLIFNILIFSKSTFNSGIFIFQKQMFDCCY